MRCPANFGSQVSMNRRMLFLCENDAVSSLVIACMLSSLPSIARSNPSAFARMTGWISLIATSSDSVSSLDRPSYWSFSSACDFLNRRSRTGSKRFVILYRALLEKHFMWHTTNKERSVTLSHLDPRLIKCDALERACQLVNVSLQNFDLRRPGTKCPVQTLNKATGAWALQQKPLHIARVAQSMPVNEGIEQWRARKHIVSITL